MFFNVGVDEHGQKIHQKAVELGYDDPQLYCDMMSNIWKSFCHEFKIEYNNFYRTSNKRHQAQAIMFFGEIKKHLYTKPYKGKYCIGCESFKTEKEIVDNKCTIHNIELTDVEEENTFFDLKKWSFYIKDILVNKQLSPEFENLLKDVYDLSITRKNVDWGVPINEEGDTLYVWFEALLNYIFAIGYYDDPTKFNKFWKNSLQLCGKDNLKFQSHIFQALLLANDIPQTKELLVHGIILDDKGQKMSKTTGNVIDPLEQKKKYGLTQLKYYLTFGLNTFEDSKYSEEDLVNLWNTDIVNGFGNLVARTLHLIDVKDVNPIYMTLDYTSVSEHRKVKDSLDYLFETYNFPGIRKELNALTSKLNKRIQDEKPFDKNCTNAREILTEIYFDLKNVLPYYKVILKEFSYDIDKAFATNKKVLLFNKL